MKRIALGIEYDGMPWRGWQTQPDRQTVQDVLQAALKQFAQSEVQVICAGRTDAGVHAIEQVVHFDTPLCRETSSWVRGVNAFLPASVVVRWAYVVPDGIENEFHARFSATARKYHYLLYNNPIRSPLLTGRAGWTFRPLERSPMEIAAGMLVGVHDFSALRSAECQAKSPVRTLRSIVIARRGAYWRFDFDANAFLHHMVRNIMGCLVAIGSGSRPPGWIAEVLASRDRSRAAPTFAPEGLYFAGPYYDASHAIPERTAASDWLP